jgi:enoyl-CoA hydratase/carnithine racemase
MLSTTAEFGYGPGMTKTRQTKGSARKASSPMGVPARATDAGGPGEPYVRRVRGERGAVTLTLDRPRQLNVLSSGMIAALQAALDEAAADESVRVVVIAGAGRAFCAGHDLGEMRRERSVATSRRLFGRCSRLMTTIRRMPQPVVARVHGIATAAGCQLVATCDLAVAADTARFAVGGIHVGLFCATPAVALSRNVTRKQAFEMLVTGDFIDAETARARGLVNRVVSLDALDAEVDRLAASIAAKPAAAIAMGKQSFYRQSEMGIDAAYAAAGRTMARNLFDESAREGIDAFLEKRRPRWAPPENCG